MLGFSPPWLLLTADGVSPEVPESADEPPPTLGLTVPWLLVIEGVAPPLPVPGEGEMPGVDVGKPGTDVGTPGVDVGSPEVVFG